MQDEAASTAGEPPRTGAGEKPPAARPRTRLPVAASEPDIDLRQVGPQRVLVAFEQHDVHIGMLTRDTSGSKVDGQPPAI